MKTTTDKMWLVTNKLGRKRTFDCELEAHCWASLIGYSARVTEAS